MVALLPLVTMSGVRPGQGERGTLALAPQPRPRPLVCPLSAPCPVRTQQKVGADPDASLLLVLEYTMVPEPKQSKRQPPALAFVPSSKVAISARLTLFFC